MTALTQTQGQTLTALLAVLRPDWQPAGIGAALRKAADHGSFPELCVAACRCAANPDTRTPALIAEAGPHWQGTAVTTRPQPRMCVDHPARKASGCPDCFQQAVPRPASFTIPTPTRHTWTEEDL
jgi:hypothetical protein